MSVDAVKVFSRGRDIGLIVDPEGTIIASTRGGEEALAYGSLGLAGIPVTQLLEDVPPMPIYGTDLGPVARLYRDIHLKTGAGRLLTIHAISFPLRDGIEPQGARLVMEQEIHRAVPEARGIGKPLGLLYDSIGAAAWSFDAEGTILTWNRISEAYFAHSRAGQFSPASVFLDVQDLQRVRGAVDRDGLFQGAVPLVARDGKPHVNRLQAVRLISEEGDPVGYACLSLDPEEHGRSEDLHRVLEQQTGDAILLMDRETGQILDVNQTSCDLFCCGREELLRRKITDLLGGDPPLPEEEVLGALKRDGAVPMGRQLFRRKDGFLFPASLTFVPATLGKERYALALAVDLSSRVRIEDMVRKEREILDQQKVQEQDGLKKSLQLQEAELADLRKELQASRKREEGLTRMVTEARTREEAVRRELEELKSRPAPAAEEAPPPVDANEVLQEALAIFEREAGDRAKVGRNLKPLKPVDCLPDLLKEVVLEALRGAAAAAAPRKARLHIRTRQTRRGAVLEISDRSGGIGPAVLERLFAPARAEAGSKVSAVLVPGGGGRITFRQKAGRSALCRIELPVK